MTMSGTTPKPEATTAPIPFSWAQVAKSKPVTQTPQTPPQEGKRSTSGQQEPITNGDTRAKDKALTSEQERPARGTTEADPVLKSPLEEGTKSVTASKPQQEVVAISTPASTPKLEEEPTSPTVAVNVEAQKSLTITVPEEANPSSEESKTSSQSPKPSTPVDDLFKKDARPLRDAPPPVVNFWTRRAQDAKTKQIPQKPISPTAIAAPSDAGQDGLSSTSVKENGSPPPLSPGSKPEPESDTRRRNEHSKDGNKGRSNNDAGNTSTIPTPPSRDEVSWPTPESAEEEERKRNQSKVEKDHATQPSKPHGKNEWVRVPITPSVKFNTPLPNSRGGSSGRGGRGGFRGGRDGFLSTRSPASNDKKQPLRSMAEDQEGDRGRRQDGAARSSSLPSSSRRPASADQANNRQADDSKFKRPSVPEGPARRQSQIQPSFRTTGNAASERSSVASTEQSPHHSSNTTASHPQSNSPDVDSLQQTQSLDGQNIALSAPLPVADGEETKANQSASRLANRKSNRPENVNSQPEADKRQASSTVARPERTKKNGRNQTDRGNVQLPPLNVPSPTMKQGPQFNAPLMMQSGFSSPIPRGGYRGPPRSATVLSEPAYGRMTPYYAAAPQFGAMDTYGSPVAYQYAGMMPMTMPYAEYAQQQMVVNAVAQQLNYYFSLDNLVKDLFLRKHMDAQGFVSLRLISEFKRMKIYTENFELIKATSASLPDFELRLGIDGELRIRRREGWERWVLPENERDPAAQNDGPLRDPSSQSNYTSSPPQLSRQISGSPPNVMPPQMMMPMNLFSGYPQAFAPHPVASPVNGISNSRPQNNRYSLSAVEGQLGSFAEPTSAPNLNGRTPVQPSEPDAFPDSDIPGLQIVGYEQAFRGRSRFRPGELKGDKVPKADEPNGISNSPSQQQQIEQEQEQSGSSVHPNGSTAAGNSKNLNCVPQSSSSVPELRKLHWRRKEMDGSPAPEDSRGENYLVFRQKALAQRLTAPPGNCPDDMEMLYAFWSHFLVEHYNTRMYDEFRALALVDASEKESYIGVQELIRFYGEALLDPEVPIRNAIARDFNVFIMNEGAKPGNPAFDTLKKAWRNGSMQLKNRKRFMDIMDADLKNALEALDRGA